MDEISWLGLRSELTLRDRLFELHAQLSGDHELTVGSVRQAIDQLEQLRIEVAEMRASQGQATRLADALQAIEHEIVETLGYLNRWLAAFDTASHGCAT